METYAIVGTTVDGSRRTITRNVREDQIDARKAEVEGYGVTRIELVKEGF